jgi:hypothetical protein
MVIKWLLKSANTNVIYAMNGQEGLDAKKKMGWFFDGFTNNNGWVLEATITATAGTQYSTIANYSITADVMEGQSYVPKKLEWIIICPNQKGNLVQSD